MLRAAVLLAAVLLAAAPAAAARNGTSPAPALSGGDRCDEEACNACCSGTCLTCKQCVGIKTGGCAACWKGPAGVPPCNGRDLACLSDDGLACEQCWGPAPLPRRAPPAPAAAAPTDYCSPAPACASCCTGSCSACRGYCEANPAQDNCRGCWHASTPKPITPPCNLRVSTCLSDDKLACEKCWTAPGPGPAPPGPAPVGPPPSPDKCKKCADGEVCCDPTLSQMCPQQKPCCDCGTKACTCPHS